MTPITGETHCDTLGYNQPIDKAKGKCRMKPPPKWEVILHCNFCFMGFELLITRDSAHSDDLHVCVQSFDYHACMLESMPEPIATKEEADAVFKRILESAQVMSYRLACQTAVEEIQAGTHVVN